MIMTPREIADKYVYGKHDALTDSQEVQDMINDIKGLLYDESLKYKAEITALIHENKNLKNNPKHVTKYLDWEEVYAPRCKCPSCGNDNVIIDHKFCSNCGQKLMHDKDIIKNKY